MSVSSSVSPAILEKAETSVSTITAALKSVVSPSTFQFRSSVLGFPRFGSHRQLKIALESYWSGGIALPALLQTAKELKESHWKLLQEKGIQIIPANDFSFYDHVLDHAVLFNVIPQRVRKALLANDINATVSGTIAEQSDADVFFAMARGLQRGGVDVFACEMKKYFDSNYHYLVPELSEHQQFKLNKDDAKVKPIQEFLAAKAAGVSVENIRPVILGPITLLLLSKIVKEEETESTESKSKADAEGHSCCESSSSSGTTSHDRLLSFLPALLPAYVELVQRLVAAGAKSLQIDEPIFVTDGVDAKLFEKVIRPAYQTLHEATANTSFKVVLGTFYGYIAADCIESVLSLPVDGVHLDLIRGGPASPKQGNSFYPASTAATSSISIQSAVFQQLLSYLKSAKNIPTILSLGVIDGRNIWRADVCDKLTELVLPILQAINSRTEKSAKAIEIELAPSCSLLHVPHSLNAEKKLDAEIKSWLAFAVEKVDELTHITRALNAVAGVDGASFPKDALTESTAAVLSHRSSARVVNAAVRAAVTALTAADYSRSLPHPERLALQQANLKLPLFPVTTIGSFPQTAELRKVRSQFRGGKISASQYDEFIRSCIADCVTKQEELGIDVFVHGESERNDMVEFFGELLQGFAFTENGWVQSYGSRCVKPPVLYGDVSRGTDAMTVELAKYAQSLTTKPMKAMLTGPVTMLQWSFVRDDQPRAETAFQLALAIRKEVSELESVAHMKIIQIDEAALREGLPLRHADWADYMQWSVDAFRLSSAVAAPQTQIHSHMCYSDFQDILPAIIRMDTDVLTVENARSNSRIIQALKNLKYPNKLAPGVYDIHSPRVPSVEEMFAKAQELLSVLSVQQIELVPDCGLKTRNWKEVIPALKNLVTVAKQLREKYSNTTTTTA